MSPEEELRLEECWQRRLNIAVVIVGTVGPIAMILYLTWQLFFR